MGNVSMGPGFLGPSRLLGFWLLLISLISDTHQTLTLYGIPLEKCLLFPLAAGLVHRSSVVCLGVMVGSRSWGLVDLAGWPWLRCLSSVTSCRRVTKWMVYSPWEFAVEHGDTLQFGWEHWNSHCELYGFSPFACYAFNAAVYHGLIIQWLTW